MKTIHNITNKLIKYFIALQKPKYRKLYKQFIVEGEKIINELKNSNFIIEAIVATDKWYETHNLDGFNIKSLYKANQTQIQKFSNLITPPEVIAIVSIPNNQFEIKNIFFSPCIVLDNIQDPGNLGTLIRTADWFGIHKFFCSEDTVDVYNPKVIQASMGSFLRVEVFYINLIHFLNTCKNYKIPIIGTFTEGESIYATTFPENGVLVLGNESRGISESIKSLVDKKITIPCFSKSENKPDSLNVAIAGSIICSHWLKKFF